jgi:hypothetical protein
LLIERNKIEEKEILEKLSDLRLLAENITNF